MKKFLLISFSFPPRTGVGGLRWSKLCKYLALMGHEIHVVTVRWKQTGPNMNINDIHHPNIHIHQIFSGYPHNIAITHFQNDFLNVIKRIFIKLIDNYLFWDDQAQHWNLSLIPYCERLINTNKIRVVVATGHPFQANRWSAELKRRYKSFALVQDFRDPWLHPYRKPLAYNKVLKIKRWQNQVIESAEHCVFITKGLADVILKDKKKDYTIIPNGHDFEKNSSCKDIRNQWIHAGNISYGRDFMAEKFLDVVKINPELLNGAVIKFYGNIPKRFHNKYASLINNGTIKLCGYVSQKDLFDELCKAKVAIQFNAEKFPYLVSTKIYEYAAAGIPTLSINGGGEIETLIKSNNIGLSIRPNIGDIVTGITEIQNYNKNNLNKDIAIKFHCKTNARLYSTLINSL